MIILNKIPRLHDESHLEECSDARSNINWGIFVKASFYASAWAIQILVTDQWEFTWTEVSPLLPSEEPARRAEAISWQKWRVEQQAVRTLQQVDRMDRHTCMGKYKKTNPKGEYSHPQSKQSQEPANGSQDGQTIPWPNCLPHSPEKSYKRRASIQYFFIHFCNSCSARDTRPQNLTRVVFEKSSLC